MKLIKWILFFFILMFSTEVSAQNCTLSIVSINFGSYESLTSSPNVATGEITVNCDHDLPFVIKLGHGQNSGSGFHPRKMISSRGDTFTYNLYRDSTRNEVFGDGTGDTFTQTGTGENQQFTVYGRIPARQNIRAGAYRDSVTVTLEW